MAKAWRYKRTEMLITVSSYTMKRLEKEFYKNETAILLKVPGQKENLKGKQRLYILMEIDLRANSKKVRYVELVDYKEEVRR